MSYLKCKDCSNNATCSKCSGCKNDNTIMCARCLSKSSKCLYEPREVTDDSKEKNL